MALNTQNVNLKMTAGFASQFPTDPIPQVALSGRSNVGKSSLINTLLGRKSLARVSATPGKTITVNFYEVDKKLCLVDLPGYGFAARNHDNKQQWSSLTDGYFTKKQKHRPRQRRSSAHRQPRLYHKGRCDDDRLYEQCRYPLHNRHHQDRQAE